MFQEIKHQTEISKTARAFSSAKKPDFFYQISTFFFQEGSTIRESKDQYTTIVNDIINKKVLMRTKNKLSWSDQRNNSALHLSMTATTLFGLQIPRTTLSQVEAFG